MATTRQRSQARSQARSQTKRTRAQRRLGKQDAAARSTRGRRPEPARERTGTQPSRRKALRRRWVALLSVLTLAALVYLALFSSMLGVRSVEVSGARGVPPEVVQDAADVPMGRALVRLDTDEIRDRVARVQGVATAEVSRSWPSTIEIAVTERTAVAFYTAPDGLHLVDGSGVGFRTVPEQPPGLPKLELAKVSADDASTRSVLGVLSGIPRQLREQVTVASAQTPGNVELTLADGKRVRWGDATQSERKAQVLVVLLSQPGGTYDVSSPDLPTVS